ncbi:hypothetical protein SLEP1_g37070 [Rubroshorea leprosula]|uniref:Uncharacterized protein n=1 Tax=Rubroshorea leprosula TaxID=152421 RepID=A0AAV5KTK8_9ROSI|nr:hypothetical protein SLEP1_g37070 [Rubroshorea leprosula]
MVFLLLLFKISLLPMDSRMEVYLLGISNFWCSTFILPKRVIKEVEKLCSSFLWNGSANNAKEAKVNWPSVCYPKQEGGLGSKVWFNGIRPTFCVSFGCYLPK